MSARSHKTWGGALLSGLMIAACHPQPVVQTAPSMAAAASASLTVRVRLPGEVVRHVAAIGEEMTRLHVSVTAVDGRVWERELSRPAFGSFQAETTFEGLPAGGARLSVVAFDHTDRLLGRGSIETSVEAGAAKTVELPLSLDQETRLGEIVLASGAVTPLSPSTIAARNQTLNGVLIAGADGAIRIKQGDTLHKLGQDAEILSSASGLNIYSSQLAVDAHGHIWEQSSGLREYDSDGTPLAAHPNLTGAPVLAKDGNLWLLETDAEGAVIRKVARDGMPLHSTLFRTHTAHLAGQVSPVGGRLWVAFYSGDAIVRQLAEDGQALSATRPLQSVFDIEVTHFVVSSDFAPPAPDASGHAWLTSFWSSKVSKIAPDGTIVGEYAVCPHPKTIAVDGKGNVWVGSGERIERNLVKLAPDGALLGVLTLDGEIQQLTTDGRGDVWASTFGPSSVYRLAQ